MEIFLKAVDTVSSYIELPPHLKTLYDFLRKFIQENAYAPSVREMCSALGVSSTSVVHGYLKAIEDAGLIRRNPAISRAIVLLPFQQSNSEDFDIESPAEIDFQDSLNEANSFDSGVNTSANQASNLLINSDLTHLERLFANSFSTAMSYLPFGNIFSALSKSYSNRIEELVKTNYVLTRMPDDSMVNRDIAPNDFLIFRRQDTASSGDIVVVRALDETLVRVFFKGVRQVRLQPESDIYATVHADSPDIEIFGIVEGFVHLF